MSVAVNVFRLSVRFGGHTVLHDVSVRFPCNCITVMIGHSGSGKTTLLRALNRLNEEYDGCETKGRVDVDIGQGLKPIYPSTQDKTTLSLQYLRQKIGMVFQTPTLLPVSIYRNIAMPLELVASCPRSEINTEVEKVLALVGLWDEVHDRLNLPADRLSGGQQQRLCLARTLALAPAILLLDEPTGSLDVHASKMIEDLLEKLRTHYTIIMVSHSLEQACRLADQLIVMENGQLKANVTCAGSTVHPDDVRHLIGQAKE